MTKILPNRKSAVSINHIRGDGSIHPRSETFENETTTTPFKLQYIYGETTGAESLLEESEELLPLSSSSLLSSLEYEDQTVESSSQPSASIVNTLLPSEGKGYYSLYSGTKRNRQYGTKSTIDSLTKIGEEWSKRNPNGPRIGVGDISKHGGGKLPPHKSHTRGIDVDIRPIRADKVEGRTTWKEASYSQKLTRELIQLMRMQADIRLIFFNDPTLVKEGLTLRWPGHDNHLHVRFKEPIQTSVDTEHEHFRGPDEITQAWEEEHELNIAQGKTIYLPTRQDSTLFRKVGIFIPSSFQPSAAIDLIVYFHGHIIPACKTCPREFIKKGIEYYWNTSLFKCLREDLVASGQNAILVAPTFRPIFASKNNSPRDYGSLNEPGKFDILVNDTLVELQKRGELPVSTQVRNIILSGHSGGGLPMKAILNARNAMKKNIAECWGFECLYFGTSAWESWLKGNPNCHFRHFRRSTQFIPPTKALNKYANFIDVKDGTNHCSIVKEKWRQAIEGSNVLRGGGGGGGRSPEFTLINREVPSPTSFLSGLPGLATLPLSFMTALMGGFQDENHLTNLIFFARHPGLGGRKLTASDPQSLKDEWMSILKTIVRPAIQRMKEAGTRSSAGSVPTVTQAGPTSPVIDSKFSLTELKLGEKKIPVASAGDKKKGMAVIIEEAPAVFLPQIIGMARDIALKEKNNSLAEKLDPTTWFKKFTRINFLGRLLAENQYLNLEMAKLLKVIENQLVKKYGGDAKSVGDMVLNNSTDDIKGSRQYSATATFSMHMFGLAVDVNYHGNPYIQTPGDIGALNNVLKNAALLMNEPVLVYKHGAESNFDRVQQIDAILEKYFSLLDAPEMFSRYLQTSSSPEWRRLSAADARTRIQKNLANLAGYMGRNIEYFKKHGILDLDKRFVLQMTEQGLDWGASYGDMMHFDMRSSGVGKYINVARLAYARKVKDLARRLFNEKRYGTHSP